MTSTIFRLRSLHGFRSWTIRLERNCFKWLGSTAAVPEIRIDRACKQARHTPHQRLVDTRDGMGRKLLAEARMRLLGLRGDHEARRVLVDAMHDARPEFPANARQRIPAMGNQRIHQRAITIARRRMHNKARLLVDDDDVLVFKDDVERNVFALRFRIHGRRNDELDHVPLAELLGRIFKRLPVKGYGTGFD